MKRTWKDVSVPLRDGMVHWPGDPECHIKRVSRMEDGAVCNLTHISMSAHTGTHMDAPRHFIADGITMEQMPFEAVIGRCRVFELDCEDQITADDLKKLRLAPRQRVLFKTRNSTRSWATNEFDKDFVSIRQDAAQYLVEQEVMTVGVDYLSIGGFNKDGVETHQIMLGAGIWVIEGLNLAEISDGYYELICLPIKLEGADGAPCRVVLR
ncbi:MAG: cyclase family protein [Prosthecobacter sp.]|jgi:arylformamidase|uniref:cyclase family protein n=1 Tax=Prosthecobacter sp. TaxID=1965333 RepID=UPI0019E3DB2E|nr:cyclase family protein [Prosthecobacter sp.]MBE2283284.1 cyclase family protein [Prosthecobacter sp.]